MKMKEINSVRRCRLCACEENLNNFCGIFDEDSTSDIEMKITKLLPVVVMPWDPMPHKVCHSCIVKLNYFDEFYEGCLRAERFLRTLYPTAPEKHIKNFDPVVEVLERPILKKTFAFSPHTRETRPERPENCRETSRPITPDLQLRPITPDLTPDRDPKRTLNCFIVNELTSRDCIFTCRECFRTFTKESSALTHTCVRLEDSEELRTVNVGSNDQKKSLPPLKIRLFSMKSGFFVCYLCQAPFEVKEDLLSHLKIHFLEEQWREREYLAKRRGKRRRNDEDDSLKSIRKRATKRKKRKWSRLGRRKSRRTSTHSATGDDCNSLSPATKEAADSPQSQYSPEEVEVLEDVEVTYEEGQKKSKPCAIEEAEWEDNRVKVRRVDSDSDAVHEEDAMDKREEVTVIEVVNKKSPTSFSSCVFCDKIFATNGALVAHQKKHLGCLGAEFADQNQNSLPLTKEQKPTPVPSSYSFLCSTCAMMFSSKKTLLEHEQYHLVDMEAIG